jgi:hypothetical protein
MVPSYNSLPFDLGFLSLACWTLGLRARATVRAAAWGALGGVLFAGSCLCYLPRFALVVIPVGVLAWARGRRDSSAAASTAALLGAMVLVAVASCGWLAARGLVGELLEAIRFQAQSPALAPPPGQRLLGLLQTERARALPSTATHLLFAAAALVAATRSSARAWVGLLAVAYAVVVTGVYVRHGDKSVPAYALVYTGLCWLPLVVYPFLRRRLGALHPDVAGAAAVLFLMGAGQQAVAALTSTQAAAAGIPGLAASLLLLLLLGEAAAPEPRRLARLAVAAFCLCLAANGAAFHFYAEQNPLRVATSAFASGRLRGIRSSERFVTGWSRIDEGLRPRLRRGEFLLAYENIPLLYYLTDTRPALRATYVSSFVYAPPQQQELLDEMVRKGRIPRYAVRLMEGRADEYVSPSYSPRPQEDPINAFVLEHYRLEVLLPPFEVFRHR